MAQMTCGKYLKMAIPLILLAWASYYLLIAYGYANEFSIPPEQEYRFEHYEARTKYTDNRSQSVNRAKLQEEYDFHHFNAIRCYQDAYNRAWYLPDITVRQRFKEAWIAAFTTVGVQTAQLKLVVAISSFVMQYGLDCFDEYHYIQDKLNWSEYHFRECEKIAKMLHG